jgi:hypothetical protein
MTIRIPMPLINKKAGNKGGYLIVAVLLSQFLVFISPSAALFRRFLKVRL